MSLLVDRTYPKVVPSSPHLLYAWQESSSPLTALPARAQQPMGEHELADRRVRIIQHVASEPEDVGWDCQSQSRLKTLGAVGLGSA